ncbi:MAG TPA: M20 family metallopeptidase [Thermoplasmata archaeon]|nr:M20 family metallopeptidase [Thermoplasmata archaeon]HUJ78004.1 M20 family metallopeptidase [Thermoplasmata archaeon]
MPSEGTFRRRARRLLPRLRRWRAALHAEPELSNEEVRTQATIVAALREMGIEPVTFPRFTGVVGWVDRDRPGPVVAARADMDALPIQEATGLPFASRVEGRMHACGHDVHMTCLLGLAALAATGAVPLRGPVELVFQPAEEEGRTGGAKPFLARGIFDHPPVDFVVGQHVTPELPVGTIGWRKGPVYAAADRFRITVDGVGAHAGYPHLGRDAIVSASEIVLGLQALVSRRQDPSDPAVVSVGMIHGGTRHNVLPDRVVLEGTVRTLRADTRARLARELKRRVRGIAASLGARARVEWVPGYPPTVNAPAATELVVGALAEEFGERALVELDHAAMGAEDFAYYLERVPGTFLKLGAGRPGRRESLHTPRFAPPDETLVVGTAALAAAVTALQRGG